MGFTAVVVTAVILLRDIGVRQIIRVTRSVRAPIGPGFEVSPRAGRTRPVLRNVQAQRTPADLTAVHLLDRLPCVLLRGESNEREAPRAARLAILRNVNVHDFPNFSEQRAKLFVRRCEIEVPYEYLARDD